MNEVFILDLLNLYTKNMEPPMSLTIVKDFGKDPFLILVSCLLSLRAKDPVVLEVCRNLFKIAKTPEEIVNLPDLELNKIFFKLGFYKKKTVIIKSVCKILIEKFGSKVPSEEKDLLSIKHVGPKTAALVQSVGFDIPAVCVDVHVHRVSNRLGLIKTKNVKDSQSELKKILDKKDWSNINNLLVMWGQNICKPVSPLCSKCPFEKVCPKNGVFQKR